MVQIKRSEIEPEPQAAQLLKAAGLCPTTSEARRVIQGGGAYIGEEKTPIASHDQRITLVNGMLLWVGKKRVCRVELVD